MVADCVGRGEQGYSWVKGSGRGPPRTIGAYSSGVQELNANPPWLAQPADTFPLPLPPVRVFVLNWSYDPTGMAFSSDSRQA